VNKKFYVTTPIYYVTAKPHLGSLYSTLIADVAARWHRLLGYNSYFVTGTDEHGQKVAQAAQVAGLTPHNFVDSLIPAYKDAWSLFNIGYDKFMRTSTAEHKAGAQALITHLLETGDVYKDAYEGWYCTPCETFVTEKDSGHGVSPLCPSCAGATLFVQEETYFFRLSTYQERLLNFYTQSPHFVTPKERFNEVIRFVEGGLKDLSISRTTVPWGVPFPGDTTHTIYVWVEALCNYITAVGYGDSAAQANFAKMWPADLQVIGKDIIRFHAVYWPALLMAAGLELPQRLLVHGWITIDQKKMSKSLSNVVDPVALGLQYGVDPVRYYLLRHMPITHDGDFSIAQLEQSITAELAHTFGNLFNRMAMLADAHGIAEVPVPLSWSLDASKIHAACEAMMQEYAEHMANYYIHLALGSVWQFLHGVNAYFHAQAPWKLITHNPDACRGIFSVVSHALYAVAVLLLPIMPEKMLELLQGLGCQYVPERDTLETMQPMMWNKKFTLVLLKPLFIKPEPRMSQPSESNAKIPSVVPAEPPITFDDLLKVALHVGTILTAQSVEKSEKLLQLDVDFGDLGIRHIVAGIKQFHLPETIIGTQALFVYNLKPRTMAGVESQGMMMMAKDEQGVPQIVRPVGRVPNGTRLN
jgi:methionyl-tRNA synthetase